MTTIKDVAKKADVAVTTVSRVLNNRGYISDETRQRVYAAMEALHYEPNELARSLSRKHSRTIGVLVPTIMHPFYSKLIEYVEIYARQHEYNILLYSAKAEKDDIQRCLVGFKANRVSGIIWCLRTQSAAQIIKSSMPMVAFERSLDLNITAVCCDNLSGGFLAAKELNDVGCKNVAIISGTMDKNLPAGGRTEGFIGACSQYGMKAQRFIMTEEEFIAREYWPSLTRILMEHPDLDGIFATSDLIAMQVLQLAKKQGLKVPDDLKIVGFDDVELTLFTIPQLTTIHQPLHEMCSRAVSLLMAQIAGQPVGIQEPLPVRLIKRGSTRKELEFEFTHANDND